MQHYCETAPRCHRMWRRSTAAKLQVRRWHGRCGFPGGASLILAARPSAGAGDVPDQASWSERGLRPPFGVNLCTQRRHGELVDGHRRCPLRGAAAASTGPAGVCVVLIGDESANQGWTTQAHALAAVQAWDAVLFSIAGLTGGERYVELAEQYGGRAFEIVSFRNDYERVLTTFADTCVAEIAQGPDLGGGHRRCGRRRVHLCGECD